MLRKGERNLGRTKVARRHRQDSGKTEQLVWELLRNSNTGFKFRRQVPVLDYILDFYCPEAKLCIETDGEHHAARLDKDEERDNRLIEHGILTVRMPTADFWESTKTEGHKWLVKVVALCEERTGRKTWERL